MLKNYVRHIHFIVKSTDKFFISIKRVLVFFYVLLNVFYIWGCTSATVLDLSPELAGAIYHKQIKVNEKKIDLDSANNIPLIKLCETHTKYAYGFLLEKSDRASINDFVLSRELKEEALKHFIQGIMYGELALSKKYNSFELWIKDSTAKKPDFVREDIPVLYWLAAAYGGAVKSSFAHPDWLIKLPRIGRYLDEALYLEPHWNYGALYTAMISYTMSRPDAPNNKIEVARHYFELANHASGGYDSSPFLALAENVSKEVQNKEEFIVMLNSVLAVDKDKVPDLRLGNRINQNRAKWLLNHIDEFFY